MTFRAHCMFTGLVLASLASGFAQEKSAPREIKKTAGTTIGGIFEATESTELSADTEQLKSLKIKRIVAHGTRVRKGQVVVAFETEDVDEKIKAANADLQLARITMNADEFSYEQFKATQELDRAAARRTWQRAKQAFDNFQQVDRDRMIVSAEFSLKSSQASLANAMEELKQLEQMYKEDELTEESEEIVLKRAKQSVDSAQYRLESSKISTTRTIEQGVPQQTAQQKDSLDRAELAFQKAERDLKDARARRDIEMTKKREKFAKQEKEFKDLQQERRKLTITAPHDGIVLHGSLTRGKLSDKPSTLKAESSATSGQVLVTLANPARLQIRTELSEAMLKKVSVGATGKAKSTAYDVNELKVRVKSVDKVPYANNKFGCVLTVTNADPAIMPGTSCTIRIPAGK